MIICDIILQNNKIKRLLNFNFDVFIFNTIKIHLNNLLYR